MNTQSSAGAREIVIRSSLRVLALFMTQFTALGSVTACSPNESASPLSEPEVIFLVAGQSNAANAGESAQTPQSQQVFALGDTGWQRAVDPQPYATGSKGSPWPGFGDEFVRLTGKSVGIVSVAYGGSVVEEWLPSSELHYSRLFAGVQKLPKSSIKAVLWHQGESDSGRGTTSQQYFDRMSTIIQSLNQDTGRSLPWIVAEVSYLDFASPVSAQQTAQMAAVRQGQQMLWDSGVAYQGPTTDDLVGDTWRFDGIHLSNTGLQEHGKRWAQVVQKLFF